MITSRPQLAAVVAGLAIIVAACGSATPNPGSAASIAPSASPSPSVAASESQASAGSVGAVSGDPAGAVKDAFGAAQSGGFAGLANFACAAQKDKASGLLGGGDLSPLASAGIDPQALLTAMKFSFSDLQTTLVSGSGTSAKVHVTGTMKIDFDQAAMREIMKRVLGANGGPTDDATLTIAMNTIAGKMSQTKALDEDVNVVNEGGRWLICA